MTINDKGPDAMTEAAASSAKAENVSFLDRALWRRLDEAPDMAAFADAWLTLLCRVIDGTRSGFVAFGAPDAGPFEAVAIWPAGAERDRVVSEAAEAAVAERRGVVQGRRGDGEEAVVEGAALAFPFLIEGRLHGVAAIEVGPTAPQSLRTMMRLMQWSAAWIELRVRKEAGLEEKRVLDRTTAALELMATALDEERFRPACSAVVTELTMRLDCDRVSIGFLRRGHTEVVTMSHSASFGKRMTLVRQIGLAMDEAIDQRTTVLFPPDDTQELIVTQAHAELSQGHGVGQILTVPLTANDEYIGAITFERPVRQPFDQAQVDLTEAVVAMLGPILSEKRRNDRLIVSKLGEALWQQVVRLVGPSHAVRKLVAAALIAIVAFGYFATGLYRVTATARIEGAVRRVIVASFDGYVATAQVRAGDTVTKGQMLASLDDKDLVLERLKWVTTRQQRRREYDKALAGRDRAEAQIAQVQIEQAEAQIALIDEQLKRTALTAPFEGLVISGDLSQSIGAAVKRGDVLFEIAPLTGYRVILQVDESEIGEITEGQQGTLLVTSIPDNIWPFTVTKIMPVAEVKDGRNTFRVEARLDANSARLRPAMEGVGKVEVGRRRLVWIWTRGFVDRMRLWIWRWLP